MRLLRTAVGGNEVQKGAPKIPLENLDRCGILGRLGSSVPGGDFHVRQDCFRRQCCRRVPRQRRPVHPPGGPVEGTYKTLVEVEPRIAINEVNTPGDADSRYRIVNRGSYYLTGDLPISMVRSGIEIAADNVTIDLMGFTLYSVDPLPLGSPPISLDGITTSGVTFENIHIRNGVIKGFGQAGVAVRGRNCRFDNLRVHGNVGHGLEGWLHSVVTDCVSQDNGGNGFDFSSTVVFRNCHASENAIGFNTGQNAVVIGCISDNNTTGIFTQKACRITDTIVDSSLTGIDVGPGSVVTGCVVSFSGTGINARVAGSEEGTTITECAVTGTGIGISVSQSCYVFNNTCDNCINSGILATSVGNRIEGNHVSGTSSNAFQIEGTNNLVIRNTATSNGTNYQILAGNRYGPIIDITAATAPAVNGSAAPSSVSTTDPWANFSH